MESKEAKTMAIPPSLASVILALLITSSSAAGSSPNPSHEGFAACFVASTASSEVLFTPDTAAYSAVLNSSVQNVRFLNSPTAQKPLLIVTPTAVSHVQAAVVCGREQGLRVRARSGGHDYEGMSYVSYSDRFVVLDLSHLRSVTVDEEHRTAWVEAGATLGEFYYAIASRSRTAAFSAGECPTVGVGGHFSGGGYGMISRKYGVAADSIIDAKLVDVHGRLLNRESMGEDYFWAIRGGGGGSFGIVVAFEIKLATVPPTVAAFSVNRTLKQGATKLVSKWQLVGPNADENLFLRVVAQAVDDQEAKGNRTVQAKFEALYLGRCEELVGEMEGSFPELGLGKKDCKEMSWLESVLFFDNQPVEPIEKLLDRTAPANISSKVKSDFVKDPIPEEGLEEIWKFLTETEGASPLLAMEPFGGVLSEVSESAIPFPHRKGNLYVVQYIGGWFETDLKTTERHLNRMRKLYALMTPYVSKNPRAVYVNFKDIDLGRNDEAASYAKAKVWGSKYFKNNFRRLSSVKSKVDPHNFFRNEQSIPPLKQL